MGEFCRSDIAQCIEVAKCLPLLNQLKSLREYYGHTHPHMPSVLHRISIILDDSPLAKLSIHFLLEEYRVEAYYLGSQHPDLAETLYNIGQAYAKNNQLSEAADYFIETSLLLSKTEKRRPLYALSVYNLGLVKYLQTHYDDAMKIFNLAIEEQKNILGEFHLDVAEMQLSVGKFQRELGMLTESMENLLQSLLIVRMKENSKGSKMSDILYNIGLIYEVRSEHSEALNAFHQACAITKDIQEYKFNIELSYRIGLTYQSMGDSDNAIKVFERIVISLKEIVGDKKDKNMSVASVLGLLCYLYAENGMIKKLKDTSNEIKEIYDCTSEDNIDDSVGNLVDIFGFGCIINDYSLQAAAAA